MLKDVEYVMGRGCILVCDDEDFNVGDKIILTIRGVERLSPSNGKVGLLVGSKIEKERSE